MICVQLTDVDGHAVGYQNYCYFSGNQLILQLLEKDCPSQISGVGPHFSIELPHSIRVNPLSGEPTTYEGRGDLGSISMVAGAAARDGTESHKISRILANSWAADGHYYLDIEVEVGQFNSDTSSGGYAPLKEGQVYLVKIVVQFDQLLKFLSFDLSECSQKYYADKLDKHFKFQVPGYESLKYA